MKETFSVFVTLCVMNVPVVPESQGTRKGFRKVSAKTKMCGAALISGTKDLLNISEEIWKDVSGQKVLASTANVLERHKCQ